ncbi:MAG TPA: hypothetical protein PKA58_30380 [Polyangium sp.]|nr:hypothetical protein [Polyangium sp.]
MSTFPARIEVTPPLCSSTTSTEGVPVLLPATFVSFCGSTVVRCGSVTATMDGFLVRKFARQIYGIKPPGGDFDLVCVQFARNGLRVFDDVLGHVVIPDAAFVFPPPIAIGFVATCLITDIQLDFLDACSLIAYCDKVTQLRLIYAGFPTGKGSLHDLFCGKYKLFALGSQFLSDIHVQLPRNHLRKDELVKTADVTVSLVSTLPRSASLQRRKNLNRLRPTPPFAEIEHEYASCGNCVEWLHSPLSLIPAALAAETTCFQIAIGCFNQPL